jgi:hypothetical protein
MPATPSSTILAGQRRRKGRRALPAPCGIAVSNRAATGSEAGTVQPPTTVDPR